MLEISKRILKLISTPDIDSKKNYRLERRIINLAHRHILRPGEHVVDDKIDAKDHSIPVRIFYPKNDSEKPGLLIFFHGGGWVTGSLDSYEKVCFDMAEYTGRLVLSVDYRLAPEHKFPAAPDDCFLVTQKIFENAHRLGIHPMDIALIGDSAGGNLAAVVSLMARDQGAKSPPKQILLYPATDSNHSSTSPYPSVHENGTDYILTNKRVNDYIDLYRRNDEDLSNPYLAPIYAKDLSQQPETLIITAEFDPLRDEGELYGKRLIEAGNYAEILRVSDALHGFFSNSIMFGNQILLAYETINRFLQKPLEKESSL